MTEVVVNPQFINSQGVDYQLSPSLSEWEKILPVIHRIQECDTLRKLKEVTLRELEKAPSKHTQVTWLETDEDLKVLSFNSLHQFDLSFLGQKTYELAERLSVVLGSQFFKKLNVKNPSFLGESGVTKRVADYSKTLKRKPFFLSFLDQIGQGVMTVTRLETSLTGRTIFVFTQRAHTPHSDEELNFISQFLKVVSTQFNLLHKIETRIGGLALLTLDASNLRILNYNVEALFLLKGFCQKKSKPEVFLPKELKKSLQELLGAEVGKSDMNYSSFRAVKFNDAVHLYRAAYSYEKKEISLEINSQEWIAKLTLRQVDVVLQLKENLTKSEISSVLGLSERTVDGHCEQIYQRLGVSSRIELINMCSLD